jgi:hypothetical protein
LKPSSDINIFLVGGVMLTVNGVSETRRYLFFEISENLK